MSQFDVMLESMVMKECGYSVSSRALVLAAVTDFGRYDQERKTVTEAALDILRQGKCDN
jgi:hypothetical protein